ncbi:MAG: MFS transporter [Acuticoccus sp.]
MTTTESVGLGRALAPVTALLAGVGLLYLGNGLQMTLVPLRAEAEGFGGLSLGLIGATYFAGFVAGCFMGPVLIRRAGHIRAFAAMVSVVSAVTLAFPILVGEVSWVLFRFATGVCVSGVLVIIESWLNDKASTETRGAVMSAYIIITYVGMTLGQLGVAVQPLSGFALFSISSILISLAAVPVALTKSTQPAPVPKVRFRPLRLWRIAPAAFVGAVGAGVMTGSVLSLGAVFAVSTGFSTSEAAAFAAVIMLGGAIGQYPFGRTSDFIDRRLVLLIATLATIVASVVLMLTATLSPLLMMGLGFALGFVLLPSYALSAAHAFDWTEFEDMVETSVSMTLLYGLGSSLGPVLASVAMLIVGPSGLMLVVAAASGALATFVALRVLARKPPAEANRAEFDLYATAPVGPAPNEVDVTPLVPDDEEEGAPPREAA